MMVVAVASMIVQPVKPRITAADAKSITAGVFMARMAILEDKTPVSFCKIPELFDDSTGEVLIDKTDIALARYKTKSACPVDAKKKEDADYRRVTIDGMRVWPDSIQVYGNTLKAGGDLQVMEVYNFVRSSELGLVWAGYRVVQIMQS